jgi:hypothetical protein
VEALCFGCGGGGHGYGGYRLAYYETSSVTGDTSSYPSAFQHFQNLVHSLLVFVVG